MAQTTSRDIVIGALILTALLTGTFTLIGLSVPDNAGNFTDYNQTYNKFSQIKADTEQLETQTEDAQPDEGPEGILSGLYSSSFGAVKNTWTSITTLKAMINDLNEGGTPFKMPSWFTGLLASIIGVTLAFALISSWQKWYT